MDIQKLDGQIGVGLVKGSDPFTLRFYRFCTHLLRDLGFFVGLQIAYLRQNIAVLGRFCAIKLPAFRGLSMRDRDFGWTVERQIKVVAVGLRVLEVYVITRKRRGGNLNSVGH